MNGDGTTGRGRIVLSGVDTSDYQRIRYPLRRIETRPMEKDLRRLVDQVADEQLQTEQPPYRWGKLVQDLSHLITFHRGEVLMPSVLKNIGKYRTRALLAFIEDWDALEDRR